MRTVVPTTTNRARRYAPVLFLACILAAACDARSPSDPEPDEGPGEEPPPSEVRLPDTIAVKYREDAARLAARRVLDEGGPAAEEVRLPSPMVDGLFEALARVYATTFPARDSVVEIYGIHTFPSPTTRGLLLRVDPAVAWVQRWREGNRLTGEAAVDSLMTGYALELERYAEWRIGQYALLRAAETLNVAALANRFAGIRGVLNAGPDGVGGDGNDIRASPAGAGWRLDFSVGWGDCFAGCIHRRTWSFEVLPDAPVEYRGASGDPPPEPGRR